MGSSCALAALSAYVICTCKDKCPVVQAGGGGDGDGTGGRWRGMRSRFGLLDRGGGALMMEP